ncbi:MAG: hypothetical protein IT558_01715 [Alphaproteobacteria bacterium]|nr:hypothetical protein [Alphaproteobacteria bacterium]
MPTEQRGFFQILIIFLFLTYIPYITFYAFCLTGLGGWTVGGPEVLLAFVVISVFFLTINSLINLFFTKNRKKAINSGIIIVLLVLLFIPSIIIADRLRIAGFYFASLRAAPLIIAIRQFEHDHGLPPKDIQSLVPEYITAIPYGLPPLKMHIPPNGMPWTLSASVSTGFLNWDAFIYKSDLDYSEYGQEAERLADWIYYHE